MGFGNFFEEVKEEFNYDEKRKELIDNLNTLKETSANKLLENRNIKYLNITQAS